MKKNALWNLALGLSVFGVILALYLLWQQFFHPAFQPCNVNSLINCNAIISGGVAKTLGIPTPLIGLIGYLIIFFSAIFQKKKLLLGMAIFGFVFCAWIAYQELFLIHVLCPVCLLCQLDMLTVLIVAFVLQRKKVN